MSGKPTYEELEQRVRELEEAISQHAGTAGVGNHAAVVESSGDVREQKRLQSELIKNRELLDNIVNIIDITDRKRTEEALRESEERLRSVIDHAPVVLWAIDHSGNFTFAEGKGLAPLGLQPGDVVGRSFFEMFADYPDICLDARKALAGETFSCVRRFKEFVYDTMYVSFVKEKASAIGAIGVAMDVTEQKRLEEELQQSRKMEAVGTLAGGIAHDFNNSLGAILGYTEMAMLDVPEESRTRYYLDNIYQAGERARDLVKQILTFSRRTEQVLRPLRVSTVVREAMRFLRPALPSTIEICQTIETDQDVVLADATQIHQIVMNLCTNAAHAMREKGGLLAIGLRSVSCGLDKLPQHRELKPGSYVELTVSDTGHGIEPSLVPRIFDPYFTTKRHGEGTGMGLAVVHGIVKGHGGAVSVDTKIGEGTTFRVHLPLLEEAPAGEEETPSDLHRGREKVLFVDDETVMAELGQQMLSSLGYEVTALTSSLEALDLFGARSQDFDLVILDVTMPHMTGLDLAREMIRLRPGLPVILCTGYSELLDRENAADIGIREVIMKPFSRQRLCDAVRRVLDQPEEAEGIDIHG